MKCRSREDFDVLKQLMRESLGNMLSQDGLLDDKPY